MFPLFHLYFRSAQLWQLPFFMKHDFVNKLLNVLQIYRIYLKREMFALSVYISWIMQWCDLQAYI